MFRTRVPGTDAELIVEPRFGFLPPGVQILALALALLVAWFLVWRLYRTEMRLTSRGLAGALFALRLLIVVAVIALVVLRPKVHYTGEETVPSVVLVALDLSSSMDVA